ncbi:methionine ABC transporter permease [Actinopolymorpha sp. B9G3]|uniref:methionine ABC transporter permease n=1 Tax=Actinopolymorpha sp. B9G3 TaxID=3158970 RepID=UPI0032D8DD20
MSQAIQLSQGRFSNWNAVGPELADATLATLSMVSLATLLTVAIGLPLGVLLMSTGQGGPLHMSRFHRILGVVLDTGGSLPFLVLLIAAIPLTRRLAGESVGVLAAIVPLTLAAVPFFARRVERSLGKVDRGLVDAAYAMGGRTRHILVTVLLREGLSRIVTALALTIVVLLGYSAIAGFVYPEGLGRLAITYGYSTFRADVIAAIVVVFVVLTQLVKVGGDLVARRLEHRR